MVRLRNIRSGPLRCLSLDVQAGEILTVLGPRHSGKTRLLMVLAGFAPAKAGEVLLGGRPIARTPPHRRGIGVVFRRDALFGSLSVAGNVGFPLRARGVGRRERQARVAAMLEAAGLGGLANRRPRDLDRVQRRRALLARALIGAPDLLLLDEPLRGLEPAPRAALREAMRELCRGRTVIHASADATDALALSDRVAVLAGGAIAQLGAPETLYTAPSSAAVARSLGEINQLPGVLTAIEEDTASVRLACGPLAEATLADAAPETPWAVGQPCLLLVRPERVAVAAVSADELGGNALPAALREIVHLGPRLRLRITLGITPAEGSELIVDRPAVAGLAGLSPGRSVAVAWQPAHACVVRPESAPAR